MPTSLQTRTIRVSTDTFAAIWADRRPGEDSEDEILRRNFGLYPKQTDTPITPATPGRLQHPAGYHDRRSGTSFPEGFEIFRTFKGTSYRAKATSGSWCLLNTNTRHDSLNRLSEAIGAHEDAWHGWRYRGDDGNTQALDALRDQAKITKRRTI